MSLNEWTDFFIKQGIKQVGSFKEYERGKQMIYPMNLSAIEYDKALKALAKVVGV